MKVSGSEGVVEWGAMSAKWEPELCGWAAKSGGWERGCEGRREEVAGCLPLPLALSEDEGFLFLVGADIAPAAVFVMELLPFPRWLCMTSGFIIGNGISGMKSGEQ